MKQRGSCLHRQLVYKHLKIQPKGKSREHSLRDVGEKCSEMYVKYMTEIMRARAQRVNRSGSRSPCKLGSIGSSSSKRLSRSRMQDRCQIAGIVACSEPCVDYPKRGHLSVASSTH
eukprot:3478002-Amphidinium_carterae.3